MSQHQPPGGYGPPPQPAYGPPATVYGHQHPGGPMMMHGTQGVWRCPFCGYQGPPLHITKVSTAGWVVFAVLLLLCFVFCWIGLLMKDSDTRCPQCRTRVG